MRTYAADDICDPPDIKSMTDALNLPVTNRYKPHDDCENADVFGRWNDWKLVTLLPGSEDAAAEMEEDDALHLLNCDTTLHELKGRDGKPLEMPKGSSIVDAVYLNPDFACGIQHAASGGSACTGAASSRKEGREKASVGACRCKTRGSLEGRCSS